MNSRDWLDPPHNRTGFVRVDELARTERISRGAGPVGELPRAEKNFDSFAFEFEGREFSLSNLLEATYTDALLVLHDGAVTCERYAGAMAAGDTHIVMSVSKSIAATLCGIYVARGRLDPGDRVGERIPELRNTAWQDCQIQHLLDMRTGTRWHYDRDEVDIFDVSGYRATDRTDLPSDTAAWIRSIDNSHAHGGAFRYVSLASDVLGWILEKTGGEKFSKLVSRELWSQIGAEHDAAIITDAAGFPVVEGGVCATLRDLGRFGQLCLEEGRIAGREVIPSEWLARLRVVDPRLVEAFASSPDFDPATPDAFYHDNWWIEDARAGVYWALGVFGQILLVHHPTRTVVVKFSSQPELEDPHLWALERTGLRALCQNLGSNRP